MCLRPLASRTLRKELSEGMTPLSPEPTFIFGSLACGEHRQLSVESPLEGGPRLAARNVDGEVRKFVQYSRSL